MVTSPPVYGWGLYLQVGRSHPSGDVASRGCGVRPNPDPTQPETSAASGPSFCGVSRRLMRPPIRWGLRGFHFRPKTGCFSDPGSPHRIIATAWTDVGQPPAPNPDFGGDRLGKSNTTATAWAPGLGAGEDDSKGTPARTHSITNSDATTAATRSSVPRMLLSAVTTTAKTKT